MFPEHDTKIDAPPNRETAAYTLVVRGPNGRPSVERFETAAAYQARVASLNASRTRSISVDDLVDLLDV